VDPHAYCEAKVTRSRSSFAASFRVLPERRRRAITAVYAFCREVDDVVDEVTDPAVARVKLAWWRAEIAAAYEGSPQHPVAQALKGAVGEYALPREHFNAVIDGMAMDLDQNRYLDFAMLEGYCHRVAGVVGLLSAEIFGYEEPATRDYARDLGIAFQLTNIIRDIGEDSRRGRIYIPDDELKRFGVSVSDILARRTSAGFGSLMAFQVARARQRYKRALTELPARDRRAQRPGLIMAAIYGSLLDEIERDGYHVLDKRIALTPLAKAWIAWKTSWSY
jgi:15-cis-phytoene synthase